MSDYRIIGPLVYFYFDKKVLVSDAWCKLVLIFVIIQVRMQKCFSGGERVFSADQAGGSDKVSPFQIEGRESGPAVSPLEPRM